MEIRPAKTQAELAEVGRLFREYEAFLNVDLCFQKFEEELAGLPGKYARPDGELLIGLDGGKILGCVAVRRLDDTVCEMKRLFVRPEARGSGMGRQLGRKIIAVAREIGYALMRLDTLDRLTKAMHLYESFGFRKIAPYYDNPLPDAVYWELDLRKEAHGRHKA